MLKSFGVVVKSVFNICDLEQVFSDVFKSIRKEIKDVTYEDTKRVG